MFRGAVRHANDIVMLLTDDLEDDGSARRLSLEVRQRVSALLDEFVCDMNAVLRGDPPEWHATSAVQKSILSDYLKKDELVMTEINKPVW